MKKEIIFNYTRNYWWKFLLKGIRLKTLTEEIEEKIIEFDGKNGERKKGILNVIFKRRGMYIQGNIQFLSDGTTYFFVHNTGPEHELELCPIEGSDLLSKNCIHYDPEILTFIRKKKLDISQVSFLVRHKTKSITNTLIKTSPNLTFIEIRCGEFIFRGCARSFGNDIHCSILFAAPADICRDVQINN